MVAAYFLIILTSGSAGSGGGVTAVPFASRDFCEAARESVQNFNLYARGVCVDTGAVETSGEQRK